MTTKIDGATTPVRPLEVQSRTTIVRARGDGEQQIDAVAAPDQVRLTGEAADLQALERRMGSEPAGVDQARVDAIRAALADGSYAIDAGAIASRMLSLDDALGR